MKKMIAFLMILAVSAASFSQQTNPAPQLTKQDYLQKSKKQKTAAWIFLGSGVAIALISNIADPANDIVSSAISGDDGRSGLAKAAGITGFACIVTSIPLFIASGKNRRKAMNMSFKFQQVPQLNKNSFVKQTIPSLTLKINL